VGLLGTQRGWPLRKIDTATTASRSRLLTATAATAAATTTQRESVRLVTCLVVVFSIHLSPFPRVAVCSSSPPSLPPHYYEQLLMADRLSLRLVRPSKMDELQSEKLSGATGQPERLDQFIRQLRLFSGALAAFVFSARGRVTFLSLSHSLSLSPIGYERYLHAVA